VDIFDNLLGISALVIAIQMITTFCRHLKYIKNIYLITNARGSFDPDGLEEIAQQLKDKDLNLTVL
jgi:ATP-dependent DNA helicase 2 subunit 2